MIHSKKLNKYSELYNDFLHPNPNINSKATFLLRKDFDIEFMDKLLTNLKEEDLVIRRKSILALGEYGDLILPPIVQLYFDSESKIVKVSCLKTIIKVIVNLNLKQLDEDLKSVVDSALKDSSPEIILSVISLLRQIGANSKDILMKTCRDKDLLKAKASVSALFEIKDQDVIDLFEQLLNDNSTHQMIKEDILRDRLI